MTPVDSDLTVIDMEKKLKPKMPEEVMESARKAFGSGKTKSLQFRKRQLQGLERFLDECSDEIERALYQDLRKHRQEVFMTEIDLLRNDIRHTLLDLEKWMKPEQPPKTLISLLDGVYVYRDPYGVVLVIGAWNYPFLLLLAPMIGAIAGGNCVILKPSEITSRCAEVISRNLPRFLDENCYQVVTGGADVTSELLQNKFDYIFFTGSTAVGKIIHQAAAKFLTPTTLELGGKSPVYLDDTVDIVTATRRILWGKCLNSGQTCIAPDFLLCSKETEEKFIQAAPGVLSEFFGENIKASPFLSKIVTDRHYKRLMAFIQNSKIALGGVGDPRTKIICPTILTDVKLSDPVMREEIFGPILPIVTVNSPLEALNLINENEKPLALYIFSKNKKVRSLFLEGTSSGAVTVNDTIMHISIENLPFGGVGGSGMGAYHGRDSFNTFTHRKSVLVKSMGIIPEATLFARYAPFSEFKLKFLQLAMKKRRWVRLGWLKWVAVFGMGVGFTYSMQYLCRDEE